MKEIKIIHASTNKVAFENQVLVGKWYEKGWTHILRPLKNVDKLVSNAKFIADCNYIGYSQEHRHTLKDFFDNNQTSTKLYCDCSSFVETSLYMSNIIPKYQGVTTKNIIDKLSPFSAFEIIKYTSKDQLQNGDIILKVGSHCGIIAISNDTLNDIPNNQPEKPITSDKPQFHKENNGWTGKVIADSLRVRNVPNGTHIKSLFHGEVVSVIEKSENWLHIKYRDIDGWVYADYIRRINNGI